jgi:hypothetical protein
MPYEDRRTEGKNGNNRSIGVRRSVDELCLRRTDVSLKGVSAKNWYPVTMSGIVARLSVYLQVIQTI